MSENQVIEKIRDKYEKLLPYLNLKTRRIWAGVEAKSLGWGGITQVSLATGLSRTTIFCLCNQKKYSYKVYLTA